MHVDYATPQELEQRARADPLLKMTMHAAVWKGADDEELVASIMDQPDHLGLVWLSFSKGKNPAQNNKFRNAVMSQIKRNWPEALQLPIMPTGAIPLHRDLIRTPKEYVVDPDEAHKYSLQ